MGREREARFLVDLAQEMLEQDELGGDGDVGSSSKIQCPSGCWNAVIASGRRPERFPGGAERSSCRLTA
jgi:hypothetical protein